jgi:hypothetical protein
MADKGFISHKLAKQLYEENSAKLITPARRNVPQLINQLTEAFNFNITKVRSTRLNWHAQP